MNKNGISQNAVVQTEIGKITFLAQINTDQIYCMVNLDENDGERSEIKNIENPYFIKYIQSIRINILVEWMFLYIC